MSVNIVTGYTGVAHVTSDDDRAKNSAIFGSSKFILDYGKKFAYEKLNNNQIRIKDGMAINQGTQMGIELNDFEDVVIENGTSGKTRIDLIVLRYEKNLDSGKESASLQVIKGTEADSSPTIPNYLSGNILDGGDLIDDMPLYSVTISSLTISAVNAFSYTELTNLPDYYASADELISELAEKIIRYTAGSVTGVKGSEESTYRDGDVSIDLKDLVSTDKNAVSPALPLPTTTGYEHPRVIVLNNPDDAENFETHAIGLWQKEIWHYHRGSGVATGNWVKVYPRRSYVNAYAYDATFDEAYKEYTVSNIGSLVTFSDASSIHVEIDKVVVSGGSVVVVNPIVVDITSLVKGMFSPDPLTQSSASSIPQYRISIGDSEYIQIYSNSLLVHLASDGNYSIGNIRFIVE